MPVLKHPQRVLMTVDAVGGVWTYALELAAGLAAEGVETLLAVLGPPPDQAKRAAAQAVPGLQLEITGLGLEWQDRRGLDAADSRTALLRLARRFEPDIMHLNGFREATFPFRAPKLVAAHSCVRSWWHATRRAEPPPEWAAYVEGVTAGLAAADLIVTPTRAFRFELEQLYGALPRARVVFNGRELPEPKDEPRRPFILAAGRLWDAAKNVELLTGLAPTLPWPVLLAGAMPADRRMPGVCHLGELDQPDLLRLMQRAEVFCAPARYEPFGLAILEAAASGAALVLSDLKSLRELWKDAALFVRPDDPRSLEEALHAVIADHWLRRRLQRSARERARSLDRRRMVRCYLELYGQLLRQTVAAPRAAA